MSDKPGTAFTGVRPRSFSRIKGSRSRVSSIEEADEGKNGTQPLVSHTFSGGFGRSDSSVGGERTISSLRIAGSRSGESDGRGRGRVERELQRRRGNRSRSRSRSTSESSQGAGTIMAANPSSVPPSAMPPPAPVLTAPRHISMNGGNFGASPGQAEDERTQELTRNHQASVGTAPTAVDGIQTVAQSKHFTQQQKQVSRLSSINSGRRRVTATSATPPPRRASIHGPASHDMNGGAASAFDSPPNEASGDTLSRRAVTGHPVSAPSAPIPASGSMDLMTTIGTPAGMPPGVRNLSRAASERPGRTGFGQRGR